MTWGRIRSHGVDRRPAFNQQSSGFGLAEKTGEMQCRETVCRSRVEGGTVANAFLQALDTAKRSGFENIKRLFPVGDQFRQVAAAAIEGMHEQADAIRAVSLRSSGILFQKSPKAVGIACLHEFEGAMEVCHERLRVLGLVGDRISQPADARDRNFDDIAGDYRPDPLGRAGGDQVAGFERHDPRNVTDDDIERENKIPGIARLPHVAVHRGLDLAARPRIKAVGDQWTDRTESIEAFGAGPLAVFVLQIAGGEIVDAGVAEDVRVYVIAIVEAVAAPRDYHAQFPFIVGARGDLGPKNCSARPQKGRWRLKKKQRFLRNLMAEFSRMFTIVAAHADNLRRLHRRQ